jgi:uncharacterized protein YeaO (DUF488 family)
MFKLKRVYDESHPEDGFRVLVERLWPRGVTRADAALDLWLKDVAPSTELRKWFGHDPAKWNQFRERYWAELDRQPQAVAMLLRKAGEEHRVTLVYSARDQVRNSAVVLKDYLQAHQHRAGHR